MEAPSTIWKRRKLAPGRAVPHQAMPQPVPGEIQDESSDSSSSSSSDASSSSNSDASSWESGAPWAGEPLEDGEQEL